VTLTVVDAPRFGFLQHHIQQRPADLDVAVVRDETLLSKFVHEETEVGAAGADHLGERLLTDLWHDVIRPIVLAIIRQDQQESGQALLGRVKPLVDQILLHTNAAFDQTCREQFGKLRIFVKRTDDARLG
jgi:hypothetical protein